MKFNFQRKPVPNDDEADEAAKAEASPEELQRGGSILDRRISQAHAEAVKRGMIGPRRKFFTLDERMRFLEMYEVKMDQEPMPIPTSPTHHAEILEERRKRQTPTEQRSTVKAAAMPQKKRATFFTW